LLPVRKATRQRQILDRPLFDAGSGRGLQTEDKNKRDHEIFLISAEFSP
jgi:hypothetical protein